MRRRLPHYFLSTALVVFGPPAASTAGAQSIGLFTGSTDIGTPSAIGPGSSKYDAATQTYTISGGGENMWAAADHFRYVWKKVSGDVLIEASVQFVDSQPAGGTPDPHRKACLIIRQSLDSNAVYADAARHGDGLTSLTVARRARGRHARSAVERRRSDPAPAGEARQLRVDVDCRCRRDR